jgi:hypothetical protein
MKENTRVINRLCRLVYQVTALALCNAKKHVRAKGVKHGLQTAAVCEGGETVEAKLSADKKLASENRTCPTT